MNKKDNDNLKVENSDLIFKIAKKYANSGIEQTELHNVCAIGLCKAVYKYENGKEFDNIRFRTYAMQIIESDVQKEIQIQKLISDGKITPEIIGDDIGANELTLADVLADTLPII